MFYATYPSYDQIIEYPNFSAFPTPAANGAFALDLSTNILYVYSATIPGWVAIAGPGNVLSVGTFDSQPGVANGLQIAVDQLIAQSATASVPGMVNTGLQTFAGNKTFTGSISAANLSGTNSGDVTLGTANGLSLAGQVLSLGTASSASTGALTSTDWNTFNSKQNAFAGLTQDGVLYATSATAVASTNAGTQYSVLVSNGSPTAPSFQALSLNQTSAVTGTLGVTNGGTGQTTLQTAMNALAGAVTSGYYLRGNGTNVVMSAIQSGDLPNLSGTYVTQSEVGAPNGVAPLGASGKIAVGYLPADVFIYQGTWNPSTNTPTLVDGTGVAGYVYWVSAAYAGPVSGLNNASMVNFQIGDLVLYNGTQWQLTTPAAGVSSVNGAQGAVTVNAINQLTGDITTPAASGSQSEVGTISAGAVTLAKMANLAANSVIANTTGSAATPTATTLGTVTEATSSILTLSGWTDATIGSPTIQVKQAGTSQSGYLSSTDWNTFNSKGSGTVTSVSVASANGFAGTSSGGATPSLTLSTTVTGILYGNGTSVAAAVAGNFPTLNQNTTGTAANITATSNSTLTTLSALSLPGSQVTGNISGNAANITATSNSTLTTLSALSLPGSQVTGNISGNAANITATSNSTLTTLSALSLPTSQLSGNISLTSQVSGTLPVGNGGTGQSSNWNADGVIYASSTTVLASTSVGTSGQVLMSNGSGNAPSMQTVPGNTTIVKAPTVQKFTSGSGTYTLPTGPSPIYLRVRMVGGGGGGGGSGTGSPGTGGNGTSTTFGPSLLIANGGNGAAAYTGGSGGTASLGSGPVGLAFTGGSGQDGASPAGAGSVTAGDGAVSPFGGAGTGSAGANGKVAQTNTGSGGGGAGDGSGVGNTGGGGGAGGWLDAIITNPSSTYSYAIGTGGSGGSAGGSGYTGGAGASGILIVEEFYQ